MTPRERLRSEQFSFFCYHLLCTAVRERGRFETMGYATALVTETVHCGKQHFVVYFVGHKKLNTLTRSERGCNLGRAV